MFRLCDDYYQMFIRLETKDQAKLIFIDKFWIKTKEIASICKLYWQIWQIEIKKGEPLLKLYRDSSNAILKLNSIWPNVLYSDSFYFWEQKQYKKT